MKPHGMARHNFCADRYFAESEPRKDDRERDDEDKPEWGSMQKSVSECLAGHPIVVCKEDDLEEGSAFLEREISSRGKETNLTPNEGRGRPTQETM